MVRRREGEKGAERGSGFGPWIEAVIFRLEVGGVREDSSAADVERISR